MHARPVTVLLPNGESGTLLLPPVSTFRDLKLALELEYGIPFEMQILEVKNGQVSSSDDWISLSVLDTIPEYEILVRVEKHWIKLVTSCLNKDSRKLPSLIASEADTVPLETRIYMSLFMSIAQWNNDFVLSLINEVKLTCISRKTLSGRSLLHVTAAHNNFDCARAIINNGGYRLVYAKDTVGETPIDIALNHGFANVLTVMRETPLGEIIINDQRNDDGSSLSSPDKSEVNSNEISPTRVKFSRLHSGPYGPSRAGSLTKDSEEKPKLPRRHRGQSAARSDTRSRSPFEPMSEDGERENEQVAVVDLKPCTNLRPPPSGGRKFSAPTLPMPPPRSPKNLVSRGYSSDCNDDESPLQSQTTRPDNWRSKYANGLQQTVRVPPRYRRQTATPGSFFDRSQSKSSDEESTPEASAESSNDPSPSHVKVKQTRAVSVGAISAEDLDQLTQSRRLSRPWNEYRVVGKDMPFEPTPPSKPIEQQEGRGARRKSFQEWIVYKHVTESEAKVREEEEKKRQALERAMKEEARKQKCKTFDEWLQIKEVEHGRQREEEKKKEEMEKIVLEKQESRKVMADEKYQKWMREKFEKELAKEEELRKIMEQNWKRKEKQLDARRMSVEQFRRRSMIRTNAIS